MLLFGNALQSMWTRAEFIGLSNSVVHFIAHSYPLLSTISQSQLLPPLFHAVWTVVIGYCLIPYIPVIDKNQVRNTATIYQLERIEGESFTSSFAMQDLPGLATACLPHWTLNLWLMFVVCSILAWHLHCSVVATAICWGLLSHRCKKRGCNYNAGRLDPSMTLILN